jgi:thioredoxin 2
MSEHVNIVCQHCTTTNRVLRERLGAGAKCGKCRQPLVATAPFDLTGMNFDRHVSANELPLVVDFWAPWCGPCRMVAPELAKVASTHAGKYLILKVNTDAIPELGERFKIRSIPTMAVFSGGQEVGRTAGARPAADIEAFIESTLARG